jgi:RNA polymerase sigma factor (sigma-70 family)
VPVFENSPDLLRGFREGDRSALDTVYRHYVTDVWKLLRAGFVTSGSAPVYVAGVADSNALLDAVQTVFTKAFGESARIGYDGLRPYRPYLLRIARNVRIDQLRRHGREVLMADPSTDPPAALDFNAIEAGAAIPDAADDLDTSEQQAAARSYVARLDPEHQRFVQLRFVEELSQIDIAERMSTSRRRVRTLENQVLKGLRKNLRSKGLI